MTHPAAKAAAARLSQLVHEGKSAGEAARIVGLSPFACEVFEAVMEYRPPDVTAPKVLTELDIQTKSIVVVLKADGDGDLFPIGLLSCYPKTWDVDVRFTVAKVTPPDKETLS